MKYCDVVKIRDLVKQGLIKFYVKDSYIYVENILTKERAAVGTIEEVKHGYNFSNM